MARGGRYRVPLKRRRKGLTNYYKRRKLILSEKPRLIARVTSRHIIAQVITVKPVGDETLASSYSKELEKFGWKASTKNTSAAYLVGYLLGLRALRRNIREAILDIGLHRPTRGARVFAVAKGALDAGLKIPLGEKIIPSDDRIRGEHVAQYAKMLEEADEEKARSMFSKYFERGLDPKRLPEHFEEVLEAIKKEYSS